MFKDFSTDENLAADRFAISPQARRRFLAKLHRDSDREQAPPVLLGKSRIIDEAPVSDQEWRLFFRPPAGFLTPGDIRPMLDEGRFYCLTGEQVPTDEQLAIGRAATAEMLENAEAITEDRPLLNFNAMVYNQVRRYGEALPLTQGIHVDFKPSEADFDYRRFHIVTGKPHPLVWFEDMTARKAMHIRSGGPRMIGRHERKAYYRQRMRQLEAGRYIGMQELTPHAAVDVASDFKSYEDVAKVHGGDESTMRWHRPEDFSRLFHSASAQYKAEP